MVWNKENVEKIIVISMITTFMGQIYISPVNGLFRLSLAVVMLSVLLIYFREVPVMVACGIISILIPAFRGFVHFVTYDDVSYLQSLAYFFPAATYYILFGFLFQYLEIRDKLDKPFLLIAMLWLCDSTANIGEAIFRSILENFDFGKLVLNIIVVGFARSILTYSLYYVTTYYRGRYERKQKETMYREMVLFISSLKSELFFLRKSMGDVEDAMQMSYELYRELEDKTLKERVLTISKNVHEIKKDYYRVVNGMERVLAKENEKLSMSLKEILDLIKENSEKIVSSRNADISLDFRFVEDFKTSDFYPLISLLNNLIINSIDAVEQNGNIAVEQNSEMDYYVFRVADNGKGIAADELEMVFEPGYSTKYDPVTGRMSTGLGLSHVKQLVENYFLGSIQVRSSQEDRQTCFEIRIPKENIELRR